MRMYRAVVAAILVLFVANALYARHRSSPTSPLRQIEGVIKQIGDTSLVVTSNHDHDVTINTTADTIYRSGDLAIPRGALAVGDHVEIKAAQAGDALNAVLVKDENPDGQGPKILELTGTIKSVGDNSIVVTDSNGQDTTLQITAGTIIRKGDQAATIADLAVGDRVEVKAVKTADAVDALIIKDEEREDQDLVELNGTIKSIASGEIVITDSRGHDTTVEINDTTIIRQHGQLVSASALAMGDRVEIKATVDGATTTAVFINDEAQEKEEVEVSGTVKATGTDQITVTTRSGDVVVKTDTSTRIRKNGKDIALSDIKTGDSVEAKGTKVDATTMLARTIEVHAGNGHH